MDAQQLLQTIEERGGVASIKRDATGAVKVNVSPRTLALELLPDLQRFKPALIELLGGGGGGSETSRKRHAPDSTAVSYPPALAVLDEIERRGIVARASATRLEFDTEDGVLPVDLRALVVEHREALTAVLELRAHAEKRRRHEHFICPDSTFWELHHLAEAAVGVRLRFDGRGLSERPKSKPRQVDEWLAPRSTA